MQYPNKIILIYNQFFLFSKHIDKVIICDSVFLKFNSFTQELKGRNILYTRLVTQKCTVYTSNLLIFHIKTVPVDIMVTYKLVYNSH